MTTVETSKPSRIELDNAIRSIFPVPDTVYLVTTIGALLSIFLSFDAVCREREEGTLKLLFANPVRRGTVVLAKWLAALLSVGLPLVVATLVVVVYVVCSGALVLTVDPLWRWAMLTFLGLLYLAFFCAVGVLISTVVSTRRVSLLLGLAVWLLLVLVAPGIAAVAVRRAVPMPAKPRVKILWQEYSDAIRGTSNGPLLDYVEGVVPEEQENLRLIQVQERKAEEQRELFKVIARTTPTASYVLAGAELAGAGSTYYDAFCRADQRLANEFQTFVLEHRQEAKAGALTPEEVDLAKFPEFTGLSVSAHATLKAVMGDMGLLALEAAGVLLASVFLFVRSAEL
jgi:ABC-type transport system involved in multi-copper enzyme maturation permease subunit